MSSALCIAAFRTNSDVCSWTSYLVNPSGGGSLTIDSAATLRIGGTNALPSFASFSFDPNSNVEYYGTSQSISVTNYGNLITSGSGTRLFANGGTIGIAGTFTAGNGITYVTTGSTMITTARATSSSCRLITRTSPQADRVDAHLRPPATSASQAHLPPARTRGPLQTAP